MKIEIDDELWRLYKKSWALLGVKNDDRVIVMLEDGLWRETANSLKGVEKELAWSLYCATQRKENTK